VEKGESRRSNCKSETHMRRDELPRIHDIVRIQSRFYALHGPQILYSQLLRKILILKNSKIIISKSPDQDR